MLERMAVLRYGRKHDARIFLVRLVRMLECMAVLRYGRKPDARVFHGRLVCMLERVAILRMAASTKPRSSVGASSAC